MNKTRERKKKYAVKENRLDQDVFPLTVQDPKYKTVCDERNPDREPILFYRAILSLLGLDFNVV